MRKSAQLLLLLGFAASALQADIIYSNFGSPAAPYDPGAGDTVAAGGTDLSTSFSFVIPADHNYQLTGIDFAAYLFPGGTNAISASIYDDNGGVPGNLLYTTGEIDNLLQPPNETPTYNEEIEELVSNGPILAMGSTYWLSLDSVQTDSVIGWSYNGQGTNGNEASGGPGNWLTSSREQGAFEIDAVIAAPEPVTTVLVGSGLAMVAFLNRRRFTKRPNPTTETF